MGSDASLRSPFMGERCGVREGLVAGVGEPASCVAAAAVGVEAMPARAFVRVVFEHKPRTDRLRPSRRAGFGLAEAARRGPGDFARSSLAR